MARILIVDDTEIVRKALEVAVRRMGHEASSTSSALEALQLAQWNPPDLALLDYRMPLMDGVTLFEALHFALGDRCPRVLFVSGSPPDEVRACVEKTGLRPSGYVKKPFHLDELTRTVEEALACEQATTA